MDGNPAYQVRVEKVQFSAAHFATFSEKCERLHGHSYEVAAEVDGELTPDAWVFDFVRLKTMLRDICQELDHRFLLQAESKVLKIERGAGSWEIETPQGSCFRLPAGDVVALPLENTTAELLARWICGRLRAALQEERAGNVAAVSVDVWEGPGQRATYREKGLPLA